MISRNSAQDFLGAQRTLVPVARHAQHLRLALGAVEVDGVAVGVLGDADLAGELRAVVEQAVDARIDGVYLLAQRVEVRRSGPALRYAFRAHFFALRLTATAALDCLSTDFTDGALPFSDVAVGLEIVISPAPPARP